MELELGLQITLIGVSVVFVSLLALMGVVHIPRLILSLGNPKKQKSPQPASESLSSAIPVQHVAAIAAAVAMLGSYRVRIIEVAGNENWERCRYTEFTTL